MNNIQDINHSKLVGLQDRRRKLTDEQKAEIIRVHNEGLSLRKLAKKFEVSLHTIRCVVDPEYKAKHYKYCRDNWRRFQHTKEYRTEAMKKTRHYRRELFLKGELK